MTVGELREILEGYDGRMPVIIGFNDIDQISIVDNLSDRETGEPLGAVLQISDQHSTWW